MEGRVGAHDRGRVCLAHGVQEAKTDSKRAQEANHHLSHYDPLPTSSPPHAINIQHTDFGRHLGSELRHLPKGWHLLCNNEEIGLKMRMKISETPGEFLTMRAFKNNDDDGGGDEATDF